MKSLHRAEFVSRHWDRAKLNAVGEFWIRHAEASKRVSHVSLELRLSGFPAAVTEIMRNRLEERISAANLSCETRIEGDAVESVIAILGHDPIPDGLGLSWLSGPQFEGLVVEIRLRAGASRWNAFGIAIIGELRSDVLHVKALWITRRPGDDDGFWMQSFPEEEKLLAAIERYDHSSRIDPEIASWFPQVYFAQRMNGAATRILTKLCITPLGSPRGLGLMARAIGLMSLSALFAWLIYLAPGDLPVPLTRILLAGVLGFSLYLLFLFARYELSLLLTFSAWQFNYREWGREQDYRILDRTESERFSLDPAIRKYTADLTTAGLRPFGDVEETLRECPIHYRMFLDPDGVSYFVLGAIDDYIGPNGVRMHYWPAMHVFQSQTFFTGGGRVDSTNTDYSRACAAGRNTLIRSQMTVDPLAAHESHRAAVEEFATAEGLSVARHAGLEQYVEWQREIHEADLEHLRTHPYGLLDHLRWYLQWPRRERRGR